jgi:hypothetical protein
MADLTTRLADDFGFELDVAHVALSGLCCDCRSREDR